MKRDFWWFILFSSFVPYFCYFLLAPVFTHSWYGTAHWDVKPWDDETDKKELEIELIFGAQIEIRCKTVAAILNQMFPIWVWFSFVNLGLVESLLFSFWEKQYEAFWIFGFVYALIACREHGGFVRSWNSLNLNLTKRQKHMCESCSRVQANPDQWVASVQLRQHVSHKQTFFYLEELIFRHDAESRVIKIKQIYCWWKKWPLLTWMHWRKHLIMQLSDIDQG